MGLLYKLLAGLAFCALTTVTTFGQESINLFDYKETFLRNQTDEVKQLKLRKKDFSSIEKQDLNLVNISVPLGKDQIIELDLHRNKFFRDDFKVTQVTELGEESFNFQPGKYYFGEVHDDSGSYAAMNLQGENMIIVFSYRGESYNLERDKTKSGSLDYIVYKQSIVENLPDFICASEDLSLDAPPLPEGVELNLKPSLRNSVVPSVDIYLECDYKMYQDNGSVNSTVNFTSGLFNVIAGLYDGASVDLILSEIKVWSVSDPYGATSTGSSSTVLGNFKCNVSEYNGRVAHLLSTSNNGLGGIAQRPSCPGSGEYTSAVYGFSNISNYYDANLSNYTWTVNLFAHELGHNLGSPHTHDCSWNGNNTQIDDCGSLYYIKNGQSPEPCYNSSNPIVPNDGTIMSYCHLNLGSPHGTPGIHLANGFHAQVKTKLNETASCFSLDVACPAPSHQDMSVSNVTSTAAQLNCSITGGISWYYWRWKKLTASSWSTNTTSENFYVINIDQNEDYLFEVVLYCTSTGWSAFPCSYPFNASPSNCEDNMDISYNPIPSDVYEANVQISSAGVVSNGTNVMFDAGSEIILNPNFEVQLNSTFEAMVNDGCSTSGLVTPESKQNLLLNKPSESPVPRKSE